MVVTKVLSQTRHLVYFLIFAEGSLLCFGLFGELPYALFYITLSYLSPFRFLSGDDLYIKSIY